MCISVLHEAVLLPLPVNVRSTTRLLVLESIIKINLQALAAHFPVQFKQQQLSTISYRNLGKQISYHVKLVATLTSTGTTIGRFSSSCHIFPIYEYVNASYIN